MTEDNVTCIQGDCPKCTLPYVPIFFQFHVWYLFSCVFSSTRGGVGGGGSSFPQCPPRPCMPPKITKSWDRILGVDTTHHPRPHMLPPDHAHPLDHAFPPPPVDEQAVCIPLECFLVTARKRSLGQGNIFRSVCQEFCSQGGVCLSACWDTHTHPGSRHPPIADTPAPRANTPWEQTPPGADTPLGADTPQSKHPPGSKHPPQEQTPPCHRACWEIWSMHGRYASYWNAVLLTAIMFLHVSVILSGGGVVSQHVLQVSRPTPGGCVSQHALMQHHPCRRLLLWAVHILLECILVCPTFALSSMDYIGKNEMIRRKQNKQ